MPVAIDLGAIFIAFCAFLVCWCLLQAYKATLGALVGHLAEVSRSVTVAGIHVFGWLGDGLDHINHFVMLQMGYAVEGTAYAWHKLVGQLAAFVHETARLLNELSLASAQAWEYAYRHGIRQIVRAYTDPLGTAIKAVQALVRDIHTVTHTTTNTLHRVVVQELPRITVHVTEQAKVATQTAVKATAGAVAGTLPRVGALERDLKGIDATTKDLARKLSPAVLAGLVAVALGRIGINWTRCSNTNRWGKNVCGMDTDLLDSLLADTLLILGTVDLVEFAQGMQTVESDFAAAVRFFWRA